MSFDWQKYLYLAKELAGNPVKNMESDEAKVRSSISRAYYAAFNIAKDFAFNSSQPPDRDAENNHREIRVWFQSRTNKQYKRIGVDLNRLRISRNKADYERDMGLLKGSKEANDHALKTAERIVTNVHSLSRKR